MNDGSRLEAAAHPDDLAGFFIERANAGDVEGLVALYKPGAVLTFPTGHVATGAHAIRAVREAARRQAHAGTG